MIKLGSKVHDTITGFTGIATARSVHLNGCISICIDPPLDKDGKRIDVEWFDEQRIAVYRGAEFKPQTSSQATAGGPQPNPPRDGAK